jgi:DNA-binding PadR family transcriptional regulator
LKAVHFHILLVLLTGSRHGYGIVKEIDESTAGSIRLEPGNLYRYIGQLLKAGLVEGDDRRPAADSADERRRYYRITDAGREAVAADVARMKKLVSVAEGRLDVAYPRLRRTS